MITIPSKENKILHIFYISMIFVMAMLFVIIFAGTIFGLVRSHDSPPLFRLGAGDTEIAISGDDIRVYSGLGRQRIPLSNSGVLILSISFPYPASDIAFTEELASKTEDFRNIARDYFASLPAENLAHIDEDAAKYEILRRYNNNLRLGRINALYFTDMRILD
jgi:flagellar basal body-associated protein FliL